MRLIDKDELREAFDGTDWYHLHNGEMKQGANSALHIPYFRAEDVYKTIYCAQTIVEFEGDINKVIVKGEEYHKQLTTTWLGNFCPYRCEHCGRYVDSKERYCPNCGRKAVNYD